MKISKLNRLYTKQQLKENQSLRLEQSHLHYLQNVMRFKVNEQFRIFNANDGEFIATIESFEKKEVFVNIKAQLKKPILETPLTLALSLIKPDKMFDAINMAVQIGVTEIIPIIAERSQVHTINLERLAKIVIEAVEQSERLSIPKYDSPLNLKEFLKSNNYEMVIYANENEDNHNQMFKIESFPTNVAYLVGPEGGFSESEFAVLKSFSNLRSISLGPNVLRAETATIAGLVQIQLMREKCLL